MWPWVALTVAAVTIELLGDALQKRWLVWFGKPVASTAFLAAALAVGALDTPYGRVVFAALVLSWLGDVLLIPKGAKGPFLVGLVSFLLGHVAYGVAFVVHGVDWLRAGGALLLLGLPVVVVSRWLLPKVKPAMKGPVIAYMVVISAMVALAAGTHRGLFLGAALLFYLSDWCVARERFVTKSLNNRRVGLPLYFSAQLLFVWSTVAPAA